MAEDIRTNNAIADFFDQLNGATLSGLLLDYDGTLAPFHDDRYRAYPYDGIIPLIERILRRKKTKVAVITGRPIREVQALLNPLKNLEIWGAHGLEHLLEDGTYRQAAIDPESRRTLLQAEKWLRTTGLISYAEIKPGGIAVHWRGLSAQEVARIQSNVEKGWNSLAERPGLKLLQFEGGWELRTVRPNKGDAMAEILQSLGSDAPVAFLGDDLTDEDAFEVLRNRGLPILVRPEYRDTKAKAWLRPPQELVEFFQQWLRSIS
jgi:trehalose 6-phosphate phosphatase